MQIRFTIPLVAEDVRVKFIAEAALEPNAGHV